MINIEAVKKTVGLAAVMRLLGYRVPLGRYRSVRGRCPAGCCDNNRSAVFNLADNVWFCHRCKQGGGALDLYMVNRGLGLCAAATELCIHLGIPTPFLRGKGQRGPRRKRPVRKDVDLPEEEDV